MILLSNVRYYHQDPCAILLACLLLTKSPSLVQHTGSQHSNGNSHSPYDDSLPGPEKYFQDRQKENYIQFGNNVNAGIEDANHMVNETVLYITQLCNTANVQG